MPDNLRRINMVTLARRKIVVEHGIRVDARFTTDDGRGYEGRLHQGSAPRLPTGEERWFYEEPAPGRSPVTFTFQPKPSTFAPEHYELVRRPEYERLWYAAVELWRKATTTGPGR